MRVPDFLKDFCDSLYFWFQVEPNILSLKPVASNCKNVDSVIDLQI